MNADTVAEVLAKPISLELLNGPTLARFAYTGLDGDPRVVPVGFAWTGTDLVLATAVKSAKVAALRANPRVAVTIDTEDWPRRALLIRGGATVEIVDGVPTEYVDGGRKSVPPAEFPAWEQGVHTLFDQMARITITPDWAKLLDFETTIPKAVEDLARAKFGG
ncbi:pyridoxamine 5'-phosphate oxidase [Herbihabitans rhizosphaerae]|uniref:Pyridoxamine 5'-phosphate oxidase n=1 Tax=Herbihabitans rhizosphaerae TaxID=1872711 RepID=A0A4V2EUL4_9PSEU|nr:pyridoxamine 5'-phosphate oxidase family protein [Herbihabitans rhizosphaerae]RZS44983.1 pyridoxamine 5'-phosphate oxidase [Herbihabitans rhizosphaerae]